MATNLKKTADMDVGTVSYKNPKMVRNIRDVEQNSQMIKDITKTQQEL